jgi:hypothetical protein
MTEDKDQIIIKNKVEPKWENVIFIGLWLLILVGIFLFILVGFILDKNKSISDVGIFISFIPFFIFGTKFFQILLWNARGIEQITLNKIELRVERLGTILCTQKKYNLLDITEIGLTDKEPYSLFHRYSWNTEEGNVIFKYMEQSQQIGIELGRRDASYIVSLLKEKSDQAKKANNIVNI